MRLSACLLAATLAASVLPAAAQWVWRDAGGRVNASDLPPPAGVPDKDVLQRPAATQRRTPPPAAAASAASAVAAASSAAAASEDPELKARRKAADDERSARDRAEADRVAALRSENCIRARSHVAALESGQRLARFNAKGEREVLDDKGRAEEMQRARRVIESDCR